MRTYYFQHALQNHPYFSFIVQSKDCFFDQMPVSSIDMGWFSIWSFSFIFLFSVTPSMVTRSGVFTTNGPSFTISKNKWNRNFVWSFNSVEQWKRLVILQDDYINIFTYQFSLLVLLKFSLLSSLLPQFALRRFQFIYFSPIQLIHPKKWFYFKLLNLFLGVVWQWNCCLIV